MPNEINSFIPIIEGNVILVLATQCLILTNLYCIWTFTAKTIKDKLYIRITYVI